MLETIFNQGAYNQFQTGLQEALKQQQARQEIQVAAQNMAKQKQDMDFAAQKQPLTLEQLSQTNRGLTLKNDLDEATAPDLRDAIIQDKLAKAEAARAGQENNRIKALQRAAALGRGFEGMERTSTITKTLMDNGIDMATASRIASMPQEKLEAVVEHLNQSTQQGYLQTQRLDAQSRTTDAKIEAARADLDRRLTARLGEIEAKARADRAIEAIREAGKDRRWQPRTTSNDAQKRFGREYKTEKQVEAFRLVRNHMLTEDPDQDVSTGAVMDYIDSFKGGNIYRQMYDRVDKAMGHTATPVRDLTGILSPEQAARLGPAMKQPANRQPANLSGNTGAKVDVSKILPNHINALKANPSPQMKASFDKTYGQGAADEVLK